ncbi:MAG: flagellar regulator YcgR PilZN domain-containing protein [Gammaproteobacteria bacterium]
MATTANEYLITGKQQIIKLCRRIIASRKPIQIAFNESKQSFGSVLFGISEHGNSCFLDPLIPDTGNQLLMQGKSASVQCNLDGIRTWFGAGRIIKNGQTNGQPWLEMTLPERAWYQQRRNAFRAQTVSGMQLAVNLHSRVREAVIVGAVQDLSVSGCRVIIDQQPDPALEMDELLYRCQLLQANTQVISCGAQVRHVGETTASGQCEIGLSFTQLTPQHDSVLSQLVMKLEIGMNQTQLRA